MVGDGMASVNQTRSHCVNQMGKTHSKPLGTQHGRGTAWGQHGKGMLYVNRPLGIHGFWDMTLCCQVSVSKMKILLELLNP